MFQINNCPYFFNLFLNPFNSYHFKLEKQAGESALNACTHRNYRENVKVIGQQRSRCNCRIITAFKKNVSAKEQSGFREKERTPVRVSDGGLINSNQLMMARHLFLLTLQGNPCGLTKAEFDHTADRKRYCFVF